MPQRVSLTPAQRDHAAALLRSLDATSVERGRAYVAEGRVFGLEREGPNVSARVRGTEDYGVSLSLDRNPPRAFCTCPAFERMGACKHVAAVAVALGTDPNKPSPKQLPHSLWFVFSSSAFFARLAYYSGAPLDASEARWLPLRDWWWRTQGHATAQSRALKEHLLAHVGEIEADLDALRRFSPPPPTRVGTAYADFQERLAARYRESADKAQIRTVPPGPLAPGRHPGFSLSFDPRSRELEALERGSFAAERPLRWKLVVPLRPGEDLHVAGGGHAAIDAWELFAMRAVILALAEEKDEAIKALARELDRPLWDHVLEQVRAPASAGGAPETEWAFHLTEGWHRGSLLLLALSRTVRQGPKGSKASKWKRQPFEALYADADADADADANANANADVANQLERDIARIALCSVEHGKESTLRLGSPQGHELLRLLAQHPRVRIALTGKPDPERDPRVEIIAGDVTMALERAGEAGLAPRFRIGGRPVAVEALVSGVGGFRAGGRNEKIVSAYVPPALRRWVESAASLRGALVFPPEAVPRLAAAAQPLISAGIVEMPREALGEELPYRPSAALRVDWRTDGAATIDVVIAVHPRAPLIAPGLGPALFTFEDEGRRVFVERTPAQEIALASRARDAINMPLLWDGLVGRTDTFEEALALAAWLEENPLGLPIEVKVGRPPSVTPWEQARRGLTVKREGSWLVLDGELDVKGTKLTLGDVLEAARLARRYVKVAEGTFLELSAEAQEKLHAIAIAAELAPAPERVGECPRVHGAFGSVVADARGVLGRTSGEDLDVYAKRFAAGKGGRVRVPPLESGELRAYQREGVAWMLRLATWAPGCVLADDMGLGKTVQTASLLKARAPRGPALVVAPASVTSNWVAELARFMPSLAVRWYNEERDLEPHALGPGDVLVVSYGLLPRRAEALGAARWATLVLDEAQYVKNVAAQRTDAVRALPRDFTIALTGTPLENHLGELFSIVDLVFPGLLGDEGTFRERFRRPIEGGKDGARLAALGRLLTPFLLRRTRAAVLQELPAREDITEFVDLAPDETKRYLALRRACEQQFAKRKKGETAAQLRIALLSALMRLRQLACDVRLVDPAFSGSSTKIARAVELVAQIVEEGNRALVFSQFTQFLDKVKAALEAEGLRVGYLTGETPTTSRRAIVDAFQRGELDVFCVSLLAGGTGLNLTRASYVIHLDPWWNPAAEEQATSRAHRMGQTEPVTVYRLVARGTIEEAVLEMQASKRELATAVLEGKGDARAIGSEELLELLRFGS